MAEEFEDRDLRDAVFWAVDLRGARFRDVDLTGARITHARLVDVDVDAYVERLVVNGVDVTEHVNANDRWYPLRTMLTPPDAVGMRATWAALEEAWRPAIDRARSLPEARRHESVGGEWSFVQTLRHLVFANDKWFGMPVLGDPAMHPIGLSNTGSAEFGWPGVDRDADPSFDDALAAREERSSRFTGALSGLTDADLAREVDVLENGRVTVRQCVHVVFEEEFHHLRYALRDLDALA